MNSPGSTMRAGLTWRPLHESPISEESLGHTSLECTVDGQCFQPRRQVVASMSYGTREQGMYHDLKCRVQHRRMKDIVFDA